MLCLVLFITTLRSSVLNRHVSYAEQDVLTFLASWTMLVLGLTELSSKSLRQDFLQGILCFLSAHPSTTATRCFFPPKLLVPSQYLGSALAFFQLWFLLILHGFSLCSSSVKVAPNVICIVIGRNASDWQLYSSKSYIESSTKAFL